MKQQTKLKGISLIVLVITIIVMIILSATIIISITNGNVISKAKIAQENSDFSNIKEAVEVEKLNSKHEGVVFTYASIIPSSYADDIEVTTGGTILLKYNEATKITNIPNALEKLGAIYIPNGFEYVTGEKETGLVIKDVSAGITDNEYVWIPVEGILKTEAFMTDEWFTNNYGDSFANMFADDTSSAGYTPMKTSVEKYNGFYVSRYEAGYTSASLSPTVPTPDGSIKPLSQKNKYVWNNIPWDANYSYGSGNPDNPGAAKVANMAYAGNTAVASSLLYGAQYDAMLNYINNTTTSVTNSTTWGNHSDSTFTVSAGAKKSTNWGSSYTDVSTPTTKPANTSWLLTTGASEQNKAKNIYDVAGNVSEWTYELCPAYGGRVFRSGVFSDSGAGYPAASRYDIFPDSSDFDYGFRFALYIK